ncbi:hypothetical protein J1N35_041146, partial [Gossypium stocksii]
VLNTSCIEKECEKEKKIEKEIVIKEIKESAEETGVVEKETRVVEFSKIKETTEKERELEETMKKDVREQEKVSEDLINKFQLYYLSDERQFQLIEKGKNENDPSPSALEGIENWNMVNSRMLCDSDLLSLLQFLIHDEKGFGNDFVRIMNKRVCDLENFFLSKWPNLRTNHLQEGGYDTNSIISCYDTTRRHQDWPKLERPKCKMKLKYTSSFSSLSVHGNLIEADSTRILAH